MAQPSQSIAAFPAWARLNGIDVNGLSLGDIPGKGFGFVASKKLEAAELASSGSKAGGSFIKVPRDLVLSAEAVNDYAKVDQNFHQLLDAASPQVRKSDAVCFFNIADR